MSEKNQVRINKFLSEIGHCSRREADKLIDQGRVKINGKIPLLGTKVSNKDEISINGEIVNTPSNKKMV